MGLSPGTELYEIIVRLSTLPVIVLLLLLCWVITSRLMSPEWQKARRNRQIRAAVAAREARSKETATINDEADPDDKEGVPR